jgi:hypothetical protein
MYPDLGYTVVILTNIDDEPRPIAYKLREVDAGSELESVFNGFLRADLKKVAPCDAVPGRAEAGRSRHGRVALA